MRKKENRVSCTVYTDKVVIEEKAEEREVLSVVLQEGEEAMKVSQRVQVEGEASATLARPLVNGQP